ncbi:MAG: cbb3-type cytochrome oxidase assembly protein CcoS [Bermanella sp.]
MEIIFITIPITLLFIASGVGIFFWANKGGQFDDLDSPAHRILFDDDDTPAQENTKPEIDDKNKEPKDTNQ